MTVKKFNMKGLYAVVASVATIIAAAVATSACMYFLSQPVEPMSLRDE